MMQSFPVPPPAPDRTVWFFGPILLLMVGITLLLAYLAWSVRNSSAAVTPEGLRLRGDLWGRTIEYDDLLLDDARVVDLSHEAELRPRSRRMGTALPGFRAGWFRLAGGGRALAYLTDDTRVLYVPTRHDYVLLISSHEPGQLLESLRRASAGAAS